MSSNQRRIDFCLGNVIAPHQKFIYLGAVSCSKGSSPVAKSTACFSCQRGGDRQIWSRVITPTFILRPVGFMLPGAVEAGRRLRSQRISIHLYGCHARNGFVPTTRTNKFSRLKGLNAAHRLTAPLLPSFMQYQVASKRGQGASRRALNQFRLARDSGGTPKQEVDKKT